MNKLQFETGEIPLTLSGELIEAESKKPPKFDLRIESQTINLDIKSIYAQVADSFITQTLGQIFYANSPSREITIKLTQSVLNSTK